MGDLRVVEITHAVSVQLEKRMWLLCGDQRYNFILLCNLVCSGWHICLICSESAQCLLQMVKETLNKRQWMMVIFTEIYKPSFTEAKDA